MLIRICSILNGRYGPYISYQKKNYKIPDSVEAADLTLDACFQGY